jgi:hypothetical protein
MFDQEKWGKKYFNKEEIDLDNCDIEKLKDLKEKLQKRKDELKKKVLE